MNVLLMIYYVVSIVMNGVDKKIVIFMTVLVILNCSVD